MIRIKNILKILIIISFINSPLSFAEDQDTRQLVEFSPMMKTHMLGNMRDHLKVINQILIHLANDELDKAADIAENRLGMSAMDSHHASHMAKFMPDAMQVLGSNMHKAASRFALVAEEGDVLTAYKSLNKITTACVACHAGYKVQ